MRVTEIFRTLQGEGARAASRVCSSASRAVPPSTRVPRAASSVTPSLKWERVPSARAARRGVDRRRWDSVHRVDRGRTHRSIDRRPGRVIPRRAICPTDRNERGAARAGVCRLGDGQSQGGRTYPRPPLSQTCRWLPRGRVEVRAARGQGLPVPSLQARYLCLSPHSDGDTLNPANLAHCIGLCLDHPPWRLSIQQHKVWRVR